MKILHILRAPVGGLFRHVVDLAQGQVERGHEVGLVVDSRTGNGLADEILAELQPKLALGLSRFPIRRQPGPADLFAALHVASRIRQTGAQIAHGHGAKGGALARIAPAPRGVVRAYTPHGGSLHDGVGGRAHMLFERLLMRRGQLYVFESEYSRNEYERKVGHPPGVVRVIHNGVRKDELEPVELAADAADVLYLGEMRRLKGVDVLIDALGHAQRIGRRLTATLVGAGPDEAEFRIQVQNLGLSDLIAFRKPMPARQAMALGRMLVLPSRAESLPYVALEAAAAGKPVIATRVGGLPEIFGPYSSRLVSPNEPRALAEAIIGAADRRVETADAAKAMRSRIAAAFSVDVMVEAVLDSYQAAVAGQPRLIGQGSPARPVGRIAAS